MAERTRKPRPPAIPPKPGSRAHYDPILIMAFLMGRTVEAAATLAQVSTATVNRRRADPEFQRLLAEARQDVFRYVTDGLKAASMLAVASLQDVMTDVPVVDDRCTRTAHWSPVRGKGRCKCRDGAPAAARVAAASRVLELTMGRRYEVQTTSVSASVQVSPTGKMTAFLEKIERNASSASQVIEAALAEAPDEPAPPTPDDPTPPPDGPAGDLPDPTPSPPGPEADGS